ncbi:alpha/beta hydrolase [Chelatococcus sp.]|uniref:alpha/beta hydrolase n=1 Tax=Chelatococcus sp. TaxID=1953771 RepID=UPI0025C01F0D|nr:alpha/beta hydrolase [Chelatococcus sp.]
MNEQIKALEEIFRSKPRPTTWTERRERMDEVCAIDPVSTSIALEPISIGAIPAEWSLAPGSDAGRVLMFLHGGGYCSGSIKSHRTMATGVGRAAGIRTLAVGYRLAPEHPFPAGLDDALSAYRFLRAEGYAAENIAIGGDSAGGGMTLACLLSLRAAGEALPACAWLASPWVDLDMTGESLTTKAAVDPLIQRDYLQGLAAAYLGGNDPRNPLISPLHADLKGLPPILVQVGSSETLLDDAVRISRALGVADVPVTLEIWPEMIHAWPLWSARLDDGARATEHVGAFLRHHFSKN